MYRFNTNNSKPREASNAFLIRTAFHLFEPLRHYKTYISKRSIRQHQSVSVLSFYNVKQSTNISVYWQSTYIDKLHFSFLHFVFAPVCQLISNKKPLLIFPMKKKARKYRPYFFEP